MHTGHGKGFPYLWPLTPLRSKGETLQKLFEEEKE
jgi:hypothetical protein